MVKKELLFIFLSLIAGAGAASLFMSSSNSEDDFLEFQEQILDLESENKSLGKELSFAKSRNEKMNAQIRELRNEIDSLRLNLETQKNSLDVAKGNSKPSLSSSVALAKVITGGDGKEEVEEVFNEESKEPVEQTLVSGYKNLDRVDPNKIPRQVERLMSEYLKDLELEPEAKEEVETLLMSYYKEQNELNYMILDPNIPADTILQKIQDLHTQTLTDLGQHVQYDVAENMISNNSDEQLDRLSSQFLGKYKRFKFEDGQEEQIKSAISQYIQDNPYLEFTLRNRSSPNYSIDTTYDDIMNRREYIGDTSSLSDLMKKNIETRKQAQISLYEELSLGLDEQDHDAFLQSLEMEENRSSRGVRFFERIEEDPSMAEAWIKLSSGMRGGDGNGRGRR